LEFDFLEEKDQQARTEEIRLMKEQSHPFIVKIIDDFLDDAGRMCIV
jgi:hypothetical protein